MTSDGKFVSVEDFRTNAKKEDYEELWNLYQSGTRRFPSGKEPKPECRFQFGATSAKKLLDEWMQDRQQLQEPPHHEDAAANNNATLSFEQTAKVFSKRSVMMTDENWDRLQKICDKYPLFKKHYVLDALLEEITRKYAD